MVATADPAKLRRYRRVAWYFIFACLIVGLYIGPAAFWLIFFMLLYVLQLSDRIRRAEDEQAKPLAKAVTPPEKISGGKAWGSTLHQTVRRSAWIGLFFGTPENRDLPQAGWENHRFFRTRGAMGRSAAQALFL